MAAIVKITETARGKTFEVCLEDECMKEPDEEHIREYHRTWTWSLQDNSMTEEDMIREVKLLAAGEKARLSPSQPATRAVNITV